MQNLDTKVVKGFGDEWSRFDQTEISATELEDMYRRYFHIFPWPTLPVTAEGFDLGCGSGRWARFVAPRVGSLHCIDASPDALQVAQKNLKTFENCIFHHASVDSIPLADESMDFGYSLGVLHHVPNTLAGLKSCVKKLRSGAPFLLYLYYNMENRPYVFRLIWRFTDVFRIVISRLPENLRYLVSQIIAAMVYWPLARGSALLEKLGGDCSGVPLSAYRRRSFYVMRTDALDRFGTRLEQRFTREQIAEMMVASGLSDIHFSEQTPFWCAVGVKV